MVKKHHEGARDNRDKRHEWAIVVVVLVAQVHTARSHTAPRPGERKLRGGGTIALLGNSWMRSLVVHRSKVCGSQGHCDGATVS